MQPSASSVAPPRLKSAKSPPQSPSTAVAERADVKAITVETEQFETIAKTYAVSTAEQYAAAGLELQKIKGAQTRLESLRLSITRPMDVAKKAVMDLFRGPEAKLASAEKSLKSAMIAYSTEQDRIRREEQRKADELARKQQEKLQQQAAKAAASGNVEKAERLETRAATVVAPVIQREAPKVAGVNTVTTWKFEIVDAAAVPREYLSVDEKKLGAVVRALKGDTQISGVRVWSEKNLAAGAA